jgi:hypothetical protein
MSPQIATCPYCGASLSFQPAALLERSVACPSCGHVSVRESRLGRLLSGGVILVVALGVAVCLSLSAYFVFVILRSGVRSVGYAALAGVIFLVSLFLLRQLVPAVRHLLSARQWVPIEK